MPRARSRARPWKVAHEHHARPHMKITRVQTRPVVVPLAQPIGSALGTIHSFGCVLVFVHDDAGGVGENLVFTLNNRRTQVVRQMIDELADLLVGQDAGHIAGFWSRAWKDINFLGHKGVTVVGISALDGALRDLLGKTEGLAMYRLLGGARDRVPAHHGVGMWLSLWPQELVDEAQAFVASGF